MSSSRLTIVALVFICHIVALTKAYYSSDAAVCGKDERSRAFLDTAVEFIEKAKRNIAPGAKGSSSHCHIKPVDCEELLHCGHNKSGVYTIWPRNKIIKGTVDVYCDMETDNGAWTVIQRRGNYGRAKDYFFKDWESYKKGFGDIEKDFWLGNDLIFSISNQREYSIRFDLRDVEGNKRHAVYDTFWIEDENEQYRLHIKDYSGDANDSMSGHDNHNFTAKDRDNDKYNKNCAEEFKGGWWYSACHSANLNGLDHKGKHESYADGINWSQWKGLHESMDTTEIKIRPKYFHKK